MISGLQIKDGHVAFAIEVDPTRGSQMEPLRKEAEKLVHALDGVLSVSVVLTAETGGKANNTQHLSRIIPAPAQMQLSCLVSNQLLPLLQARWSRKVNNFGQLALALAADNHKVGILDADIYGPSIPRMLGINEEPSSDDGKILDPMEGHGIKCVSMGFLIEEETPVIWRGPMAQTALQQMMRDINWGDLDILIVDMPPGTGDVQLTMAQQVP